MDLKRKLKKWWWDAQRPIARKLRLGRHQWKFQIPALNLRFRFVASFPEFARDTCMPPRVVLKLDTGKASDTHCIGAGYINGKSAFLGINCKDARPWEKRVSQYIRVPIQIGWTGNANIVPYVY